MKPATHPIDNLTRDLGVTARGQSNAKRLGPPTSPAAVFVLTIGTGCAAMAPTQLKVNTVEQHAAWEYRGGRPETAPQAIRAPRCAEDARVLGEALKFSALVAQVLPLDDDADRLAAQALRKRLAGRQTRKLSSK